MVTFPPCKINIGLHIIRKRADGFHDLETCFYPLPFTDMLEIVPSSTMMFTHSGYEIAGEEKDNLCVKAYQLLTSKFKLDPVHIHLHKTIPMGAGLGGGSADAAYTLKTLNALFSLNIPQAELAQYAAQLGSDCAFFIHNAPMSGTGRGEVLHLIALSLKGKYLVLLKPELHIATSQAYGGVVPKASSFSLGALASTPLHEWKSCVVNDFESSLFQRYPRLQSLKQSLYDSGAWYASMSGSGSSIYGLFDAEPDITHLTDIVWSGQLLV